MNISIVLFKLKLRFASLQKKNEMLRGKFFFLGENVKLYTTDFGSEPYLISIHDNVTCAANVHFVTHDVSCFNMARYLNVSENNIDKVGCIELFENAFVGAYSILMPNTSVGKNSVLAAGSLLTKHIPEGEVWGGVPAKFIMKTDDYAKKVFETSKSYPWMQVPKDTLTSDDLIKMRQDYFFGKRKDTCR